MESILHLERMFFKKTETFVINQIQSIEKYAVDVACIESMNNGRHYERLIVPPAADMFFRTKLLRYSDKKYIESAISGKEYSLIHTHFISDAAFFHPITKHTNLPKVASAYGYDVSEFPRRYFGLGKRYLAKVFEDYDLVLAMSDDMKNDLIQAGCPDYKIMVHYHGINTAMFSNTERVYDDVPVYNLLSVGTICEKKGQHLVVDALNILVNHKGVKNIRYKITGSGPYENLVRKNVKAYGLSDYVSFYGHINYGQDLVKQYEAADIFMHPCVTDSHNGKEGIPGVIVEAMSNGLPVITTKHAGIPSIISNYQNGLLLEENNVDQIVSAVIQLTGSSQLRKQLGTTARSYALENLDMHAKARVLEEDIYAKLAWK